MSSDSDTLVRPASALPSATMATPKPERDVDQTHAGGARPKRARRARSTPEAAADETEPLDLKPEEVTGAVGLTHEVTLLRAAIRRLAGKKNAVPHVKTLAELRHQVEALCTALKTQRALADREDDLSADLARALEALGDELGVPR